jgi:hypothetical protein
MNIVLESKTNQAFEYQYYLREYEQSILLQKILIIVGVISLILCMYTLSIHESIIEWFSMWNPRIVGYLTLIM